jgi:D-glucosaminate-6-phosphate ammonia-lyase
MINSTIYDRLGVPVIVNAAGPSTRLSGNPMRPEVAAAMSEASSACVQILDLQGRASETIARTTGAEAGLVTAGAAAALMLAAAACLARLDLARMNRLPDTDGMPNEIVMARSQRNFYDRALRQAGAKLVEVGIPDRFSGAGVRDAEPWEYEAAITPATVAIFWLAQRNSEPPLSEIVAVARRHRLPVIVDAAGQMPPASNLRAFIDQGADLVCFSGGKAIGGPQASGILAGRRDLVQSAALQQLDQDEFFALWTPPASLFDKDRMPGLPHHGIGRVAKVGKEEIVGLLTALEIYAAEGDSHRGATWRTACAALAGAIGALPGVTVTVSDDPRRPGLSTVDLALGPGARCDAATALSALQRGTPPIFAVAGATRSGMLQFNPMCLRPGDVDSIARRVREILG